MGLPAFDDLLSKKMTRKEFLIHVGLLLLAISGISSLVNLLSDPNLVSSKSRAGRNTLKAGFGHGPYGV
jgi:hypothetical protein